MNECILARIPTGDIRPYQWSWIRCNIRGSQTPLILLFTRRLSICLKKIIRSYVNYYYFGLSLVDGEKKIVKEEEKVKEAFKKQSS